MHWLFLIDRKWLFLFGSTWLIQPDANTNGDVHSYEVVNSFVVGSYDNSIKTQSDAEELTLFTCAERGTKRFVVKCVSAGEEGAYGE